jgi:rSAM/selenodomain-associated transferase 2
VAWVCWRAVSAGITVVIPTLNEAEEIEDAVAAVRDGVEQVIVVDGGSSDDTVALARVAGARVCVSAGANRATALNTGAALARSDAVYFVHADCRPPPGFADDIRAALEDGAGAGCFRMRFDSDHWLLRLSGWLTRVDVSLFRFGDQSLFVRRDVLRSAGGFDEALPVMEDQDLVRRLRRRVRFVILPRSVTTSAREYRRGRSTGCSCSSTRWWWRSSTSACRRAGLRERTGGSWMAGRRGGTVAR